MKTQSDMNVRVVSLANLDAMCERVSGMAHRFSVVKVTRSRVHVEYSNPDEWGREHPMTAVFPCFPGNSPDDTDNPRVALEYLRVVNDTWDGEGWQAFEELRDCPTLWRDEDGMWRSHAEIRKDGDDVRTTLPDTCVRCDIPKEG